MSSEDLFVRFWGVRGSIPTPGPRTRRYGGNTSCVEVRAGKTLLVFDAGTGLRELGVHLGRKVDSPITVHLFLSHPHWDHIQGFPFFGPAYESSTTIYVYGPRGDDKHYQLLSGQMSNAYFPVRFSELGARILARSFKGTSVDAGDATVHLFEQKHPAAASASAWSTPERASSSPPTTSSINCCSTSRPPSSRPTSCASCPGSCSSRCRTRTC